MATMTPRGDGVWLFRVYAGKSPAGRSVYVSRTFKGSERDARKALARFEIDHDDHKVAMPGQGTVADLLDAYLDGHAWRGAGGPRTAAQHIGAYLRPQLGSVPLARLSHEHIDAMYRGMLNGSRALRGKPLKASYVRRVHATLHSALEWGVMKGRVGHNPARRASAPVPPPSEVMAPDAADVRTLIAMAPQAMSVLVELAAATGRRRQDLLGLQLRDIDTEGGSVHFARRVVDTDDGPVIEQLDKNQRGVRLAVAPRTLHGLAGYILARRQLLLRAGISLRPRSFVFSDDGTAPWSPGTVTHRFRRLADFAGLPNVTLHCLRHFHITELLTAGVDIETVARRVGDNPETIYRVYSHFRPVADAAAALVLAGLLEPGGHLVDIVP